MEEFAKRPRFQIHLVTAILLMLESTAVLGLTITMVQDRERTSVAEMIPADVTPQTLPIYESKRIRLLGTMKFVIVTVNLSIGTVIMLLTAYISERLVRRAA